MGKQSYSIQELVSKIERGEIRLPEMQRGYVWQGTKVRDLLDSLYRDYPSGTILTWETDEPLPTRDFAISQEETANQTFQLLLDGQQRLTSLSAVIRGELVQVRGRKKPIDIMFNLEHPDKIDLITEVYEEEEQDEAVDATEKELHARLERMAFVVKNKRLEQIPHWVSVTDVFKSNNNTDFFRKAGVSDFNDPRYDKYDKRLSKLREIEKYEYDVQVLEREKSYEEVTEIFVRVNSLGAKLKGSDLALAQITAKWRDSLAIFENFQMECRKAGFDTELGIFIKNLVSFATGQCKFKIVSSISKERLENAWVESNKGFNYAMNFLKNNTGIDNQVLLSSPYILIPVAYFAHHQNYNLSAEDEAKLRYWVLMANAKGRYSRGSSEGLLDQDLREIRNGKGLDSMIGLLRTQFGRLDIEPVDLEGKSSSSSYFKTMFLAFSKDDAKDWRERLGISHNHSGIQYKLQFHHIFPQSLFKNRKEDKQKINDICNLAFIGGSTNIKINNKLPSVYLPTIDKDVLASQQIPADADLWEMDKYDEFLAERREMVVARLNEFLNHESIK